MHFKIFKTIATRGFLTAVECTKSVFGRGFAPDPAGGAHDAPPDPLVGWGGGRPLPIPHPLDAFGVSVSSPAATRPRRLRRLVPKTPSEFFFLDTALLWSTADNNCWLVRHPVATRLPVPHGFRDRKIISGYDFYIKSIRHCHKMTLSNLFFGISKT